MIKKKIDHILVHLPKYLKMIKFNRVKIKNNKSLKNKLINLMKNKI